MNCCVAPCGNGELTGGNAVTVTAVRFGGYGEFDATELAGYSSALLRTRKLLVSPREKNGTVIQQVGTVVEA